MNIAQRQVTDGIIHDLLLDANDLQNWVAYFSVEIPTSGETHKSDSIFYEYLNESADVSQPETKLIAQ